jgi:hypothetical protein
MRQYHQPLGETADPEQGDTDEMEMQQAALIESQHLLVSDNSESSDSTLCHQG